MQFQCGKTMTAYPHSSFEEDARLCQEVPASTLFQFGASVRWSTNPLKVYTSLFRSASPSGDLVSRPTPGHWAFTAALFCVGNMGTLEELQAQAGARDDNCLTHTFLAQEVQNGKNILPFSTQRGAHTCTHTHTHTHTPCMMLGLFGGQPGKP